LSDTSLLSSELEEVAAIKEFVEFEIDKNRKHYSLKNGITHIEKAIGDYSRYMTDVELANIEYAYLKELLNLYFSSDQTTEGRLKHLNKLIERCEKLVTKTRSQPLLHIRCLIALGEALKEKSFVTVETDTRKKTYNKARQHFEKSIKILKDKRKELGHYDYYYLIGLAYRQLAVIFELEGDDADDDQEQYNLYVNWNKYSALAIEKLNEIGEDTVRSYALMNWSSSNDRLSQYEHSSKKNRKLNESTESLVESIHLLSQVEDHRGLAWAYYHLCENTRCRLELATELEDRIKILSELQRYASNAVAEGKNVEDHLVLGLSNTKQGVACYYEFDCANTKQQDKLEEAIYYFKESIKLLEKTGYYRGAKEPYHFLSLCYYKLWEQTSTQEYLIKAIQALYDSIIYISTGLEKTKDLEIIYKFLNNEIRKL